VFSDTFGNGDFVRVAMAKAKSIDPTAIRYINDYNLEYNANKRGGLIRLVNSINSANPGLIQGIGTQTHLSAGGSNTVRSSSNVVQIVYLSIHYQVKAALTALAATGLDVAITELDIRGASTGDYVSVVQSCLAEPKCVSITSWGVSDKDSWIRGENGGVLLYNDNYQPKAAYNAIMSAL
jgi:endo-1,4-beta-xylanase